MKHIVLLGDATLDNGSCTAGSPAVIAQVQEQLPEDWQASLAAIDGSVAEDIPGQLAKLPTRTTHHLLSVGGNDAMLRIEILTTPVANSGAALDSCLSLGLPLVVARYATATFRTRRSSRESVALAAFNDHGATTYRRRRPSARCDLIPPSR